MLDGSTLPANIYLFKVNNRTPKKMCNMFKVNNKNTDVFLVFLQVNVSWVICLKYAGIFLRWLNNQLRHSVHIILGKVLF